MVDFNKIDWDAVKEDLINDNRNQEIWALGGSEFAEMNIMKNNLLITHIDNEEYESFVRLLDADDSWFDDYLVDE